MAIVEKLVEYQVDGHPRGDKVWLVDFAHPEDNDFRVVNQFTIVENNPSSGSGCSG